MTELLLRIFCCDNPFTAEGIIWATTFMLQENIYIFSNIYYLILLILYKDITFS